MKSLNILKKGMDAAILRRKVLANNIANADVPHFKRSEVIFESRLKRAIESEKAEQDRQVPVRYSENRHLRFFYPKDYRMIKPVIHQDYNTTMRNDGNNVDMEDEVTKLVRNQMQYSLMVDRVTINFRNLRQLTRLA